MGKNIIPQARGKGSSTYRARSFRFKGDGKLPLPTIQPVQGVIKDFVHCPGHSAPLVSVAFVNGQEALMIAPEGVRVGDLITAGNIPGTDVPVASGNVASLASIPEGTLVFNIELVPGDGGRFCRTSGVCGRVIAKTSSTVKVLLPSRQEKEFQAQCRATIGMVAGGGRVEKPFLKAGKRYHQMRARNKLYPRVKGNAQNAVDHPFGNKRSSRKAKQKAVGHFAPPGRKVGKLWPRRTGRKK